MVVMLCICVLHGYYRGSAISFCEPATGAVEQAESIDKP